jgi:hypothetical protein
MFPGVDGFHWTFGHVFFISVFLCVVATLAVVTLLSLARARRDISTGRDGTLRWSRDFGELPAPLRQCRHALTGEAPDRICPNAFDCRRCSNHAKFRQANAGEGGDRLFGMRYPNHFYYHRGHTWVVPQADGALLVGLDAMGYQMIGEPDVVTMPGVGSKVSVNGEGWRMRKDGLEVRVLCPVDGTVLQTGGPEDDWYLRVQPASRPADLRHLLRGDEVRAWIGKEIDRLQCTLAGPAQQPVMADGGTLVDEFIREVPARRRDELLGEMFLEP